jgi:Asp-tRNA(Asn)/Glu-tRNA(Gln) amidotransferase A subunit family amidase
MQLEKIETAKQALNAVITLYADTALTPAQQCKAADAIWVLGELVDLLEK